MAALDFPSSPTVGQQYNGGNGVIYQWDGAVWTLTGTFASQPAGGDLSGTYPNPAVVKAQAGFAVGSNLMTVPASGRVTIPGSTDGVDRSQLVLGTQTVKGRVSQLAALDWMGYTWNARYDGSAWTKDDTSKPGWLVNVGGTQAFFSYSPAGAGFTTTNPFIVDGATGKTICSLVDLSVTRQMLQPTATIDRNPIATAPIASFAYSTALPSGYSVWKGLMPAYTQIVLTQSRPVLITVNIALMYAGTTNDFYYRLQRDGNQVESQLFHVAFGAVTQVPAPCVFTVVENLPAGTYNYAVDCWLLNSNGNLLLSAAGQTGTLRIQVLT